jgi:hypothetical protein
VAATVIRESVVPFLLEFAIRSTIASRPIVIDATGNNTHPKKIARHGKPLPPLHLRASAAAIACSHKHSCCS